MLGSVDWAWSFGLGVSGLGLVNAPSRGVEEAFGEEEEDPIAKAGLWLSKVFRLSGSRRMSQRAEMQEDCRQPSTNGARANDQDASD